MSFRSSPISDPDDRDYADVVGFPSTVLMRPIAVVRSPFKQRHGTPRQPGLASEKEAGVVDGVVELLPDYDPRMLQDLEGFSRIWLVSWFHLNGARTRPLVRPPRGGPKRGVLSTRAPHRPNPVGLSAVQLLGVSGREVRVRGLDLLDGTPILDLKPYVSDYDAWPTARRGWLEEG